MTDRMDDAWWELLAAAREFHGHVPHARPCRLCRALDRLPEMPTLFDAIVEPPSVADGDLELRDYAEDTIGAFRNVDPSTSMMAALLNFPSSGTQRAKVLELARERGDYGITTAEVRQMVRDELPPRRAELTPEERKVWGLREHQTASRRITDLEQGGWLEPSGQERVSDLSGRAQKVMVLTQKARRHFENGAVPA